MIRNLVNGKVYIGKSNNIGLRLKGHRRVLNKDVCDSDTNNYLFRAWKKYGADQFEGILLEELNLNEELLNERELYWMGCFESLDSTKGYNLRSDSDSNCIVHELTREKISKRLKKEWAEGKRSSHSTKLKSYWNNSQERKLEQSDVMRKNLTKYKYLVDGQEMLYNDLKVLKLHGAISRFYALKKDEIVHKGHTIKRLKI